MRIKSVAILSFTGDTRLFFGVGLGLGLGDVVVGASATSITGVPGSSIYIVEERSGGDSKVKVEVCVLICYKLQNRIQTKTKTKIKIKIKIRAICLSCLDKKTCSHAVIWTSGQACP